jgi:ABC-type molybdate transport system substrate-binding protein
LHTPIEQQAVLLTSAAEQAVAGRFLAFLRSPEARTMIQAAGYEVTE